MSSKVLHVVHGYPPRQIGGTELHVRDLVTAQAGWRQADVFHREQDPQQAPLELREFALERGRRFALNVPQRHHRDFRELYFAASLETSFAEVMAARAPTVVHVHHLAGLSLGYLSIASNAGARVVLTLHDYYLACPRGQRVRPDLDLCRVIDRRRCSRCVRPLAKNLLRGRARWRTLRSWIGGRGGTRILADLDLEIRAALDHVDAFIAPSHRALELFREFYPQGGQDHVLPHGLPAAPTPKPRALPRDRPLRVGFVGSLLTTKGIQILDGAARRLDPERFSFHVYGSSGKIRALRPALQRLHRGPLHLHGPCAPEDLQRTLATLDVIVIPSLWEETFSLVLREAWQSGLPALVSDLGALGEAAGEDERALRVPPGDPVALATALECLAADAALYRRLTGPFAVESTDAAARSLESIYRDGASPSLEPLEQQVRA